MISSYSGSSSPFSAQSDVHVLAGSHAHLTFSSTQRKSFQAQRISTIIGKGHETLGVAFSNRVLKVSPKKTWDMVWNKTEYTSSLGCGTQDEKALGELRHHGKESFACIGDNKHVFTVNKWAAIRHTRLGLKGSLFAPINYRNSSRAVHPSENIIPELLTGLVSS